MLSNLISTPCRHALAFGVVLLVGVPSNVAVIWIHTRKNSRAPRDEFALILAAINLFALVTSLPMLPLIYTHVDLGFSFLQVLKMSELFTDSFQFSMNCYLATLLIAKIEKFKEVMFDCKHCTSTQATPFYLGVAKHGGIAVSLGFILTYESTRELNINSYTDVFGMIHALGVAVLVIFSGLLHVKLYNTCREMTSANTNR